MAWMSQEEVSALADLSLVALCHDHWHHLISPPLVLTNQDTKAGTQHRQTDRQADRQAERHPLQDCTDE